MRFIEVCIAIGCFFQRLQWKGNACPGGTKLESAMPRMAIYRLVVSFMLFILHSILFG
jgi:hypothetical protein